MGITKKVFSLYMFHCVPSFFIRFDKQTINYSSREQKLFRKKRGGPKTRTSTFSRSQHCTFQYGPVIKLPLQILPYGQPYGIGQSATIIAGQSDNFHATFFGNFITEPYWNAYPMT